MGQRLQRWRSRRGERLWLSVLVDTMEEVSRPEIRKIPCDPQTLIAFRAQLARSASPFPFTRFLHANRKQPRIKCGAGFRSKPL
jgi:hypothetical protein